VLLVTGGCGHSCGEQSTDGGAEVVVVVDASKVGVVPELTEEDPGEQAAADRTARRRTAALSRGRRVLGGE
jgi:hypothetical protein